MPLYEYECLACRKHTEKIQKFSDAEITICPHCGGELKRVISAPAFTMKGGGWFADGYGSAKPAAAAGESGAAPATAASSESTPASTAPPTAPASAPAASATTDKK